MDQTFNRGQIPATARSNKVATVYAVQDVAQMEALTSRQESEMILANLGNQFWGRTTNTATAERVSKMFGKIDKTYRSQTEGKSSMLNLFTPSTYTSSESVSVQQRDKLEAQQVMRFEVGEFAGLVVESSSTEFCTIFKAEPSKAVKIAPFQEASLAEVSRNYSAIKAQVRAIVGGGEVAIEQPQEIAIAKPSTPEQAPVNPSPAKKIDPMNW